MRKKTTKQNKIFGELQSLFLQQPAGHWIVVDHPEIALLKKKKRLKKKIHNDQWRFSTIYG